MAAVLVLFAVSVWTEHDGKALEKTEKLSFVIRWTIYLALIFAVLIFGIYGSGYEASQFIYFQF